MAEKLSFGQISNQRRKTVPRHTIGTFLQNTEGKARDPVDLPTRMEH